MPKQDDKLRKRREARAIADMLGLPDPHPRKNKYQTTLTPRQVLAVEGKLKGMTNAEIAKHAGYPSPNSAGVALNRSDPVQAVIAQARKEVVAQLGYTAVEAMKEAEDAMAFAKLTENANALVKAVELRSKLQGLLVEKVDMRTSSFSVNIHGIRRQGSNGQ
jgi:phage terminase small subunit